MRYRSLKHPGSDSSALQHRYRGNTSLGRNDHFIPVGNPAPPRPRMLLVFTSATSVSGVNFLKASRSPWYPPTFSYPLRVCSASAPKSLVSSLYSAISALVDRGGGSHWPLHPTEEPYACVAFLPSLPRSAPPGPHSRVQLERVLSPRGPLAVALHARRRFPPRRHPLR